MVEGVLRSGATFGAILVVALLARFPGVAAQSPPGTVSCPRCGAAVRVRETTPLEPEPKPDRDLCQRYFQDQPYVWAIWSCSGCGFSAYGEDFRIGAFPPRAALSELPITPPGAASRELFATYLNAFTYYRASGRDAAFLGDLLQKGAWAHRLTEVYIDVPQKAELWSRALAKAGDGAPEYRVYEVAAALIPEGGRNEPLTLLRIEWLRRSGEALKVSEVLEGDAGKWKGDLAEPASRIRALADGELILLRMAEGQFRAAAESASRGRAPSVALWYLLGELNRRIGDAVPARKYFSLVVEDPGASEELRSWAWEQVRRLETHGAR